MKALSVLLIFLGFAGAAFGAGFPDPTGIVEAAQRASLLDDRGLFLCSLIVILTGCGLGFRELLKRLDSRETMLAEATKRHLDFVETRHAEAVAALDQSNALGVKTNELLDELLRK